ncbi:hypothetical protein GCM10010515_77570 [Streptomyces fructofermentans]|uniref:Uncharacterized protein n=1 Tax=Streptomyces fructofermentans TaxID=152141 RepID=A0A918NVX8_9ACTN|nr:hypothetical protein GCM10010515_77570 [Streptomyces fructofermentans]
MIPHVAHLTAGPLRAPAALAVPPRARAVAGGGPRATAGMGAARCAGEPVT